MVIFLGLCSIGGRLVLDHFLAALIVSQTVASVIAYLRLPAAERRLSIRGGWGDWPAVIKYGSWRGIQQFVRPTMLNAARTVVLVIAGTAAVGEMEAARVFVAPAMLLVQGFGSYLFSSYADRRAEGPAVLLTMADRVARITVLGSAAVALLAWPLIPAVGGLLTGGRFDLSVVAVLGWACYAASCATVLPYGQLAAVQGRQQWVLIIRIADSLLSLGLVAGLLFGFGVSTMWTPWLLSVGSFVGGLLCRQWLLRRAIRTVVPA
jgi:O-antigen/teichoic acid export membrane protein